MELCYGMVPINPALKAATAIFLSSKAINGTDNSLANELSEHFSVSANQISACAMKFLVFWSEHHNSDKLTSIKRKFAQDCFSAVSNIRPSMGSKY